MADYGKQTVAQLRQLLKDRSIPSTGLQRKAQIIERLQEADSAEAEAPEALERSNENADSPSEAEAQATAETEPSPAPTPPPETLSQESEAPAREEAKPTKRPTEDMATEQESSASQPADLPTEPEETDSEMVAKPVEPIAENKKEENPEHDGPEAPAPAVEALQSAQPEPEASVERIDTVATSNRSSPALNEKPSIERPELLPIPERSTAETSRLNTEELEADSRKRKRRSGTPELPSQDIKAKKHRPSGEPIPEVYLKEDTDIVMEQRQPEENVHADDVAKEDSNGAHSTSLDQASSAVEPESKRDKKENTSRYKNLVKPTIDDAPVEASVDDRPTMPALHSVTSALYIRNFMRPLRPEPLRTHLASLACPPSSSPDPAIVKSLFLDAMKTHALVSFSTTTAASRVRASLHGSIWPPEGNRKELWVDFIPSDLVEDWIKQEEDAILAEKEARANGRPFPPKRFEVVYPESSDGSIVAVFQEVGAIPSLPHASTQAHSQQQAPPLAAKGAEKDIKDSFKTLDELFCSTAAKPQLFYLPVSDAISSARLRDLDGETSRDWVPTTRKGRGLAQEFKYKYSFDYEDRVVEVGEDMGPWAENYRGGRGGYRGRGGGRGGGGYMGRGGESWRGRGGPAID